MTIKIRSSNLVVASTVLGAAWAMFAFAAGGIEFPVKELGDCADVKACRAYCDQPDNMEACAAFAERHRLADAQASDRAAKIAAILKDGGPGGCTTASWCQAYCEKSAHAGECIAFGKSHGLLTSGEAARAQKVTQALQRTKEVFPGKCTDKRSCELYCSDAAHSDECVAFARKHALLEVEQVPAPSASLSPSPKPRPSSSVAPTRTIESTLQPSKTPSERPMSSEELEKLRNNRGFSTNLPEPAPARHSQSSIMTFFRALTYYLVGR